MHLQSFTLREFGQTCKCSRSARRRGLRRTQHNIRPDIAFATIERRDVAHDARPMALLLTSKRRGSPAAGVPTD